MRIGAWAATAPGSTLSLERMLLVPDASCCEHARSAGAEEPGPGRVSARDNVDLANELDRVALKRSRERDGARTVVCHQLERDDAPVDGAVENGKQMLDKSGAPAGSGKAHSIRS
jgi:hypothetical protein